MSYGLFRGCSLLCLLLVMCGIGALAGRAGAASGDSSASAYEAAQQALNAGNFEGALEQIQPAIIENPNNLEYQYLLGVIYLRLQRWDEAEGIFEALLRTDAQSYGKVNFDLAAIYAQRGQEQKALEVLREARPLDPGRADFETGLVYMRFKEYPAAIEAFRAAVREKPELAVPAGTQQAIALIQLKQYREAKALLQDLLKESLSQEKRAEIERILASVEAANRASKPWQVIASTGFQYDSNVLLTPVGQTYRNEDENNDDKEDVAFVASLSGRYQLLKCDAWRAGVAYNHYQQTYFDHSELDLIGARPSVYVQWENAPYFAGLEYMYGHYWVDNESRADVHSIFPRFVMYQSERWRTEAVGGIEWRDYHDITPDDRRYFLGVTEMYLMRQGKAHVRVGYMTLYDDMVPQDRGDFLENHAMVGVQWPVWKDRWFLDLSGRYIWRDFRFDPNLSPTEERSDEEQNLNVLLFGQLTPQLQLNLLFQHIWNNSNIAYDDGFDPFHYRRAVVTCMLTFSY